LKFTDYVYANSFRVIRPYVKAYFDRVYFQTLILRKYHSIFDEKFIIINSLHVLYAVCFGSHLKLKSLEINYRRLSLSCIILSILCVSKIIITFVRNHVVFANNANRYALIDVIAVNSLGHLGNN